LNNLNPVVIWVKDKRYVPHAAICKTLFPLGNGGVSNWAMKTFSVSLGVLEILSGEGHKKGKIRAWGSPNTYVDSQIFETLACCVEIINRNT
jgi:hypothetical protein